MTDDVAAAPSDVADRRHIVDAKIPADIRDTYEVHSYRNAAVVLSESHPTDFAELMQALRSFRLDTDMIRRAGGNESPIPKAFSRVLWPKGWHETTIEGDLVVRRIWREQSVKREDRIVRERFLDGHKIDYVKNSVAFDLEWNSKDQTFDRDLYAFNAFFQCGVIDAAVIVTRGASMTPFIRDLGQSLKRDGTPETKPSGAPRLVQEKYGASTTWMGKLLYRLNAGRNGGCPVLAIGITPACVSDRSPTDAP